MSDDEALTTVYFPTSDDDSNAPEEPMDLPQYQLRDGVKLWQLNDIDPTVLYSFLKRPGFILRLSSNVCIVICDWKYLYTLDLYNLDRSLEYLKAGPEFDALAQDVPFTEADDFLSVRGQVYARETCLPLQGSDLALVQLAFEMLLRFVTGLPKFQPGEYYRSLDLIKCPYALYAMQPNEISFSPELLRECFAQDGWTTNGMITLDFGQPSVTFLTSLEQITFRSIVFRKAILPRSFVERTQSSCVEFTDSQLELASHACSAISSTRLVIRAALCKVL